MKSTQKHIKTTFNHIKIISNHAIWISFSIHVPGCSPSMVQIILHPCSKMFFIHVQGCFLSLSIHNCKYSPYVYQDALHPCSKFQMAINTQTPDKLTWDLIWFLCNFYMFFILSYAVLHNFIFHVRWISYCFFFKWFYIIYIYIWFHVVFHVVIFGFHMILYCLYMI